MLISKEFTRLKRIRFELDECEIRDWLIERLLTKHSVPSGGKWSFNWWDEETQGALVIELTYKLEEPDEVAE